MSLQTRPVLPMIVLRKQNADPGHVDPSLSPLPATQTTPARVSARPLDAFETRAPNTAFDQSYWKMLASKSHTTPATATSVKNLRDRDLAWSERLAMIDGAQKSILVSYYGIGADERGFELLDHLIAAAKRGVKVAVGISWISEIMAPKLLGETKEDVAARKAKVAALEAAGGLVVYQGTPQQSLRKFGGATHHKALVVDDKAAIVGGRNIYHFHFAEDWNMSDMEMRLDGPIAQRIGTETLRVFDRSRRMGHGFLGLGQGGRASKDERETLLGELHALNANAGAVALAPRAEDPMVQSVVWDPTYDGPRKGPNQLTDALIETIRRAKHEVIITGNSLNPCRELEAAILDARARGVRVRVATAGPNGFGTVSPLPYINAGLRYHTFVDAGVEIYETTVREHGKMVIADREVVAFGSYNPEWHSDKTLVESMFFSSHAKITEPVIAAALETLSTANIVSKEKADQLGRWRHWKLLKLMIARIGNRYI